MKRIISICLIFAIALSIGSFTYANDEYRMIRTEKN
jgi:TRAP-type C4-dicarboxylate transport system permease small subunit